MNRRHLLKTFALMFASASVSAVAQTIPNMFFRRRQAKDTGAIASCAIGSAALGGPFVG